MRRNGRPAATAPMSMIFEASIMSVTTRPGATALMRTFFSAYSIATDRVSETRAAFDAEYSASPGFGLRRPLTEVLTTMAPPPCCAMMRTWCCSDR